jgi:nucleoside-diphosphate-sugar epimerase
MVEPAVQGTLGALRAATKYGVKRVVVTSSFAAVSVGVKPPPKIYNESTWSNVEMMTKMGVKLQGGYLLSKTLAEKAAWDYQASLKQSERFELVCLNPPYVYGPSFVGSGFESGASLINYMHGK